MVENRLEASGIIMAGGRSTRMGSDKGELILQGRTLADRTIDTISGLFRDTIYVTNRPADIQRSDIKVASDDVPYLGPLGGLAAGLRMSKNSFNFIVAFDMPFISEKLIRYMASVSTGYDIVVPKVSGGYEPLFAFYSSNCLTHIERRLREGDRRVISVFEDVNVREVGLDEIKRFDKDQRTFMNINTLDDYIEVKKLIEESGH